jgi:hypothetical protein
MDDLKRYLVTAKEVQDETDTSNEVLDKVTSIEEGLAGLVL